MRIIEQIVDYLFQQGTLSSEDEQYLSDSGFIRPRSWLSPDEIRAGDPSAEPLPGDRADPHEALAAELERGAAVKPRRRTGARPGLSAQSIAARIRVARPAWAERLCGLLPLARALQPEIGEGEEALAIGRIPADLLAEEVAKLLSARKGWLNELWDALCVDDYRTVVAGKGSGPAAEAWNVLLRASCLQDMDRHLWILRHRQCAWVFQLRCAQIRLLQAIGILFSRRDAALERALARDSHPIGFWALSLLYNGRRILRGCPAGEPLPYLSECTPTAPLPSTANLAQAANLAARMDHEGLIALLRASSRPEWRIAAMDFKNSRITVRDLRHPGKALLTVPAAGFLDVSPDGRRLATTLEDSSLCVYDVLSGRCDCVSGGDPIGARRPVYCADGTVLAAFIYDTEGWKLNFYDATSLSLRHSRILPNDASVSGQRMETAVWRELLAITCQGLLQVWDSRTATLVAEVRAHAYYPPQAIALSPGGETIVTACWSGTAGKTWIYAAQLPKRRSRPYRTSARIVGEAEHGYTNHMLFSPDGRTIAAAYEDGSIVLFDVATRTVRHQWKAHIGHATSLDINADGTLLLSAGNNGFACLWDARSTALLQRVSMTGEKAKLGQALLRPAARELQLVCPATWRQPYPSRKTMGIPIG